MPTPINREAKESPLYQGADEAIAYTITTTPWASSPTSVQANIYSHSPSAGTFTDVTSANMTGSATVSSDVITLPLISGLTAETQYRVEVRFTVSGNTYEPYFWVFAER